MSIRGHSLSFLPHPSTSLEGYDFMLVVPIQSSESLPNTSYIFWQTVILLNILHLCQGLPQKRLLGSTTQKEASLVAQDGKESACNVADLGLILWVGKIPWRRSQQPIPEFLPGELPWTEEPGRLQSMVSQRVRHD